MTENGHGSMDGRDELLTRILAMTRCLVETLEQDNLTDSELLLGERGELIAETASMVKTYPIDESNETYKEIVRVNAKVTELLLSKKSQAIRKLQELRSEKSIAAYQR
jgi:hypothetical protein